MGALYLLAARTVADPRATSDALLILADSMQAMARDAASQGLMDLAHGIDPIIAFLRGAAPTLADRPLS